ncbi:hypothetical protein HY991_02815 [Candidatus Micrarchaeota archaeon]|nr:hypothetical protein [Candidatus Micrarchaeota archaeon]
MGEVTCPQCGNPNLDVDAQNNVVYCRRCGFAVRVDPQSGEVTPLQQGGAPGGPQAAVYREHKVLGLADPLTFFVGGFAVLALLLFLKIVTDVTTISMLAIIIILLWWLGRR